MPDDPYVDPVTGVLRNKLGLRESEDLAAAEREITHAALIFLKESPVPPHYDLGHLCAIHQRIFGDIYDWAGQLRTVAIAKGSWFCLPQYIESSAADIFSALHGEGLLRGLPRDAFAERLTYYLGEVNAVHPFREGNGRAQRAFFEQLTSDAGYVLDWQHLDADRNVAASAAIMHGDPAPMRKLLDPGLCHAPAGSRLNPVVRHRFLGPVASSRRPATAELSRWEGRTTRGLRRSCPQPLPPTPGRGNSETGRCASCHGKHSSLK